VKDEFKVIWQEAVVAYSMYSLWFISFDVDYSLRMAPRRRNM